VSKRTRASRARPSAAEAKFVFRGTVVQRGAATLDQVPLTRDTLVVRVDEIIEAPDVLRGFEHQDVTVQLTGGLRASVNESYVFYTNGWIYGAGLAVQAVGLTPATDVEVSKGRRAVDVSPERSIQQRADRAELVVTGRVTEVREPVRPRAPITEHDPQWQQAVIAVESMPQAPGKARKPRQVVIRFAASRDVRWAEAPKFSVGVAGVWMLGDKADKEREKLRAAAGAQRNEFVVVDPADFYPADFSERILSVMKARPRGRR
jgi:hypothetical protein